MFQSICRSECGGGRGRGIQAENDSLVISRQKNGRTKRGEERESLSIRIGKVLCSQSRFVIGDRVDIKVDTEAGLGLICRVLEGGWAISASGFPDFSKVKGTINTGRVALRPAESSFRILMPDGMQRYVAESVTVKNEGILFALPKQQNGRSR